MTPEPAIYCRKCSYDLRGQVEHRCPECGKEYDPAKPKTFRPRPRRRWTKRLTRAGIILLALALVPAGWVAWTYYEWRQEQPAVQRMKELGQGMDIQPLESPVLRRLLPERYSWMLDRVYTICPPSRFGDADLVLVGHCRQLRLLGVVNRRSRLSDKGVVALGSLTELRYLHIEDKGLTDASAASLARCRNLEALTLRDTSITDMGMGLLCSLPKLQSLDIESTGLTDAGMAHVSRLPGLKSLCVSSPALTDAGLMALAGLPKLEELYLSAPLIGDDGLAALSRLPRLRELRVLANAWTPAGEQRLRQALPACTVDIRQSRPPSAPLPSTLPSP